LLFSGLKLTLYKGRYSSDATAVCRSVLLLSVKWWCRHESLVRALFSGNLKSRRWSVLCFYIINRPNNNNNNNNIFENKVLRRIAYLDAREGEGRERDEWTGVWWKLCNEEIHML
jgi:hypothetical protein